MHVTPLIPRLLDGAAALIARLQGEPRQHIAYLPVSEPAVRTELEELPGEQLAAGRALVDGGRVRGVLVPTWGIDPPRVWWWGPFTDLGGWQDVADDLYASVRTHLPSHLMEEELAGDSEHLELAAFAARSGFSAETGSRLLRIDDDGSLARAAPSDLVIDRPTTTVPRDAAELHDRCFPGGHRNGAGLLDEGGILLVARRGGEAVGYARVELEADGSGYLDFVAVHPDRRRQGIASRLVLAALGAAVERGAPSLCLTVSADNLAARGLYQHLGFVQERILVPYRKGWSNAV